MSTAAARAGDERSSFRLLTSSSKRSGGNVDASARLCASAERFRETLVLPRTPRDERKWQADVARLRTVLDAALLERAWSEGRAWEVGDAVNCALTATYASEEVALA